jgi:ribosome-binding factor A
VDDNVRNERIASELMREISDILRNSLKDPRIGFVSLTEVELTPDVRLAKVYFSVMGGDEDKRRALEGLRAASGYIRSEIAQRIRLRHVPDLTFVLDQSIERGVRVIDLLNRLGIDDKSAPKPPEKPS